MFTQPFIHALTDSQQENRCRNSNVDTIFLLTGKMHLLPDQVYCFQKQNKKVFVHVDLISGIESHTPDGMRYIAEVIAPDGIISTRSQSIIQAKKCGLKTIQRVFLIDTQAMEKAVQTVNKIKPDAVEAMPGLMPRVIKELVEMTTVPIVAGGLFKTKQEMESALHAGAVAVSASII
ncbi:glycerol-3-phosphate responsive antiterminator [Shouchella clausii]|jgi:glycerol uptake operon antiterminator|uniref:Glycerol uptake operon antiterminator regulatory protein n=1 Tax=Shouchella clausii TaxID=79880 RepID=A0A268S5E5_SHOCL|nr:glycerol-3-phosphate responsive antiterminator [Shouchella clausii]PAD43521.1 transcriptional regulator [Bacillus sp. 7520-S]AST95303.1 transcriptional regulator [Shouchella clausii]MBU8595475.1 glycerol-3-phosphate responsive antiterminator [Shouchella clausii]MCY1103522.1 glycerol-3-phosphate responsive antiterminator [Shouchella clausii]MEB5471868.1 glycerol-3-phosphate responsive antiterminator [Shouchella clausii]